MCRMATALNGRYLLQLREIGACIKQLMLECAVRDKFGDVAFRVFRLLLLRKPSPGLSGGGTHVACKLELKQQPACLRQQARVVDALLDGRIHPRHRSGEERLRLGAARGDERELKLDQCEPPRRPCVVGRRPQHRAPRLPRRL